MAPWLMSAAWGAGLRQAQRAPDKVLAYMRRTLPSGDVAIIEQPTLRPDCSLRTRARYPVRRGTRQSKTFK